MKIEVSGVRYEGFVSAQVVIRMDAASRGFSFEATSQDAKPLPFVGGEACKISVDGEIVLTGFIEKVDVDGDDSSHSIKIEGRDRTCDLVDSKLANLSDLRAPISLKSVCQKVLAHIGSSVSVVDQANPEKFNSAEDLHAPEAGKGAFDFLESLARKRQVLLSSDADGNLVIVKPAGRRNDRAAILHLTSGDQNNVLKYSVSYDSTGRFRTYMCFSQPNAIPASLSGLVDFGTVAAVEKPSVVQDDGVDRNRQHVVVSEATFSRGEGTKRARWDANVRRARARVYSPVMHGYRNQSGGLWAVNELVRVKDEYAGIDSVMLVDSVTFSLDNSSGRQTTLAMVERDAYTLELADPSELDKIKKKERKELGLGLSD